MATESGRLFVWGKVTKNEDEEPIMKPTPVPFFFDVPIKHIACGKGFTAILTDEGEVFTLGSRSWYMVDEHTEEQDDANTVVHWKELSNKFVCELACGQGYVAALTSVGLLYTWGTGSHGQLGIELTKMKQYENFKVPKPTLIESLTDVSEVSCGEECMAAISDTGKLYTWGKGSSGVLGHGNEEDVWVPKQVEALDNELVIQVKTGASHMACITENKEIYTWGNNFLGPLGRILGKQSDSDFTPQLVELVQVGSLVTEDNLKQSDEIEFVQVECLKYNTLALTSEGQLFSCGKGGADGSGHGDQPHTLFCILSTMENKTVHSIYPASACHVAALVEDNEGVRPYIWGNGDDAKLGNGASESRLTPEPLMFDPPRECYLVACGETHCAAILEPLDDDVNPDPSIEFFIESGEEEEAQSTDPRQSKPAAVAAKKVDSDDEYESDEDFEPVISDFGTLDATETGTVESPAKSAVKVEEKNGSVVQSKATSTSASTSSAPPPFQPISGILNKKGEKGFVKLWRKRWFVMDQTNITYYDKENGSKKGFIVIKDITDVLPGQIKQGFNIVTKSGRTYELQATNQDDFSKWTKAVRSAV